jgi:hypothetical protein
MNWGANWSECVRNAHTDERALQPVKPVPQPPKGACVAASEVLPLVEVRTPHLRKEALVKMCACPVSYHSKPVPSMLASVEATLHPLTSQGTCSAAPVRHRTRTRLRNP